MSEHSPKFQREKVKHLGNNENLEYNPDLDLWEIFKLLRKYRQLSSQPPKHEFSVEERSDDVLWKILRITRKIIWLDHASWNSVVHDLRFKLVISFLKSLDPESWQRKSIESEITLRQLLEIKFGFNHFLAHGTYIEDLSGILNSGLMSSYARVNAGIIKPEEIPRWRHYNVNHPDAGAIFFHDWDNEGANPGVYTATAISLRGATDMALFFPTKVIAEHAKVIVLKRKTFYPIGSKYIDDEIAVSGSKHVANSGIFEDSHDDNLSLPIHKAYVVTGKNNRERVIKIIGKEMPTGWIDQHVLFLDSPTVSGLNKTITYITFQQKREKINNWLRTRPLEAPNFKGIKKVPCANEKGELCFTGDVFRFEH